MAEVQIKRVSHRHDAIMDYLILNPTARLSEVAAVFQVQQAWLSVIIHSDAFEKVLQEKRNRVLSEVVVPLREKLLGVAHLGVDKLGECLENASPISDKAFIADTTDTILKNLGFSPKSAMPAPPVNQQNNYFVVDKGMLEEARTRMRAPAPQVPQTEGTLLEHSEDTAPETL